MPCRSPITSAILYLKNMIHVQINASLEHHLPPISDRITPLGGHLINFITAFRSEVDYPSGIQGQEWNFIWILPQYIPYPYHWLLTLKRKTYFHNFMSTMMVSLNHFTQQLTICQFSPIRNCYLDSIKQGFILSNM